MSDADQQHAYYQACKLCDGALTMVNLNHALARCHDCGLIFCTEKYDTEEITMTYQRLYNVESTYEAYRKQSERLLKDQVIKPGRPARWVLNRLFKSGCHSFLEVGAGVGLVGKYLIRQNCDYIGIELDQKTVERAANAGVRLMNGTFEIMKSIEQRFDALIAFEVIEHLQDLKLFFKLGRERLNPRGLFGFTVPNYNKINNYKDRTRIYQPAPPIHVNFFTTDNLRRILEREGFEIVAIQVRRYPYLNLRRFDTYKFLLKGILGLYYGPTIQCVARKWIDS